MTMSTLKNNLKNTVFAFILIFLVINGLIISFFQSLHFLIYLERNSFISGVGFFSLILFSQKFKNFFFTLVFHHNVLHYCFVIKKFLIKFSEKNPLFFFILVHTYFCLCFLHIIFYLNSIWNLPIEFFSNLFNLIRLFVFPLIIVSFVFNYWPLPPERLESISKQLSSVSVQLIEQFSEKLNLQKNPKTTALMGSILVFVVTSNFHKKSVEECFVELKKEKVKTTKNYFFNFTSMNYGLVFHQERNNFEKIYIHKNFIKHEQVKKDTFVTFGKQLLVYLRIRQKGVLPDKF